jgi:hypothetical protein
LRQEGSVKTVELTERDRIVLKIMDALDGRAPFDLIETMIQVQYRKHLRTALLTLVERGLVLRHPPGLYVLTGSGRECLQSAGAILARSSEPAVPSRRDLA